MSAGLAVVAIRNHFYEQLQHEHVMPLSVVDLYMNPTVEALGNQVDMYLMQIHYQQNNIFNRYSGYNSKSNMHNSGASFSYNRQSDINIIVGGGLGRYSNADNQLSSMDSLDGKIVFYF